MQCFSLMPCIHNSLLLHLLSTRGSNFPASKNNVGAVFARILEGCIGRRGAGLIGSRHLTPSSLEAWEWGTGPPASASHRPLHLPWLVMGFCPWSHLEKNSDNQAEVRKPQHSNIFICHPALITSDAKIQELYNQDSWSPAFGSTRGTLDLLISLMTSFISWTPLTTKRFSVKRKWSP